MDPRDPHLPDPPPRVVIKLAAGAERHADRLGAAVPGHEIGPYFEGPNIPRAARRPPFDRYRAIAARDATEAAALAARLNALPEVEEAYVERAATTPVQAADDPLSTNQGYLRPAPAGIDADYAWGFGDGAGVGVVDLERGWTLNHEDLAAANVTLISGVNRDSFDHGTAVLGQLVGVDNTRGIVGIAPGATCRVVSIWLTATQHSTPEAILSAVDAMAAGDVLLIELQTAGAMLPMETETAVFDAIRAATGDGIIVVEAAGNGGRDLDTWRDANNRLALNRTSADFRDSGAIMVGAARSTMPHMRMNFSNHGNRVDCFGWGENVTTAGYGPGPATTAYTDGFNGTSSASPIVAGAAVLLQSWRRKRGSAVFDPASMRAALSDHTLNTPSANPAADRIGVMPDLRAIIEREQRADASIFARDRVVSAVLILWGLVDDSPGIIWVPGKGPMPVDPDWGARIGAIAPDKRDLLAALVTHEVAARIGDAGTRAKLAEAATAAMRAAVERIGQAG